MKKQPKFRPDRICVFAGICLLVLSAAVLSAWLWGPHTAQRKAADYVQTIRTLIPEPQSVVLEERSNNTMAVLSIRGTDFLGILEIPKFGSSLPVCGEWGKAWKYPCRLSGNIYDRTMQIGGTSQTGQYDFYRELSVGDSVFFTDVEGNHFSYEVTDIRYEKHADQTALRRESAALTVFIRNIYGFEYMILYCNTLSD